MLNALMNDTKQEGDTPSILEYLRTPQPFDATRSGTEQAIEQLQRERLADAMEEQEWK